MFYIALCDDNPIILEKFHQMLIKITEELEILVDVQTFADGESLLSYLEKNEDIHFDLIFLDIMMNELSGFETAVVLEKKYKLKNIIFLTSSDETSAIISEVKPLAFLLKYETTPEVLKRVFLDAYEHITKPVEEDSHVLMDTSQQQIPYHYNDSLYATYNKHVYLIFDESEYEVAIEWKEMKALLNAEEFLEVNADLLVRVSAIEQVNSRVIQFKDNKQILLKKGEEDIVKKALIQFLTK